MRDEDNADKYRQGFKQVSVRPLQSSGHNTQRWTGLIPRTNVVGVSSFLVSQCGRYEDLDKGEDQSPAENGQFGSHRIVSFQREQPSGLVLWFAAIPFCQKLQAHRRDA